MAEIRGNTGAIKQTAASIRQDANSYGAAMKVLFDTVNALSNTWTSKDGNSYIAAINKHKVLFEEMQKNLENSAEDLETAAVKYEKTIEINTIG